MPSRSMLFDYVNDNKITSYAMVEIAGKYYSEGYELMRIIMNTGGDYLS